MYIYIDYQILFVVSWHPQDIQSFAHLIDRNGCLQTVVHACMQGARVAKFEKSELLLANGTFIATSTEADERYVE